MPPFAQTSLLLVADTPSRNATRSVAACRLPSSFLSPSASAGVAASCGARRRLLEWGEWLRWGWADVLGAGADEAVVGGLLEDVGAPADHAARRERRGEHLAGQSAPVHDDAGVELNVRVEPPARLELGQHLDRLGLDLLGQLHVRSAEALGDAAQHDRAGVVGLVHAVPEAHEPVATLDRGPQPGLGVV